MNRLYFLMLKNIRGRYRLPGLVCCVLLCMGISYAQQDRVAAHIDRGQRIVLRGYIHPKARPEFDQGTLDSSFVTRGLTLLFKRTPSQQAALDALLADQQDPASPNYHHWLTPEQYADRFGLGQADMDRVSQWLKSEGFTINSPARGRNWVSFTGTAGQVRNTFGAELHRYVVNGQTHFANATEPSIPAALAEVVAGIRGLNDFHPKPPTSRLKISPELTQGGTHFIAPDDLATIYDIAPLYKAGVDGTNQKIVVVGQTRIKPSDIQAFRTKFNLTPPNVETVLVPGRTDPGISSVDLPEADLDIEWNGAVARNATIVFVYSDDAFEAARYAIDQNLGQVISMSYGMCEQMDLSDLPTFQAEAQQANAEGITWLSASGDAGAADCEDTNSPIAQTGLAVDVPGSIPEVTSVGGTEFNDGGGAYWRNNNDANSASAISYIPEVAWNDTSSFLGLAAGGGGASSFFPKPTWQNGPGVPSDTFRDVPDVAFASSVAHDAFYVYTDGSTQYYGGTSIAAPTFAGIIALLNHYLVSTGIQAQPGVGNINPTLYQLAQTTVGVFHDITSGNNVVPCASGSPNCGNASFGYQASPGYDLATGLGSVDAANFVHKWSSSPLVNSAVVAAIDQTPVYQQSPDSGGLQWRFNLSLTDEGGIGTTLTTFTANGIDYSAQIAALFGSSAIPANGSISAPFGFRSLSVPRNVVFTFGGLDASGRQWSEELTAPFVGPQVTNFISGISNAASGQQVFAPGMIMSVYGVQMGLSAQTSTAVPLPTFLSGISAFVNGVPAPLFYVSPTQLNVQIPYESQPGTATLEIDTPYQIQTYAFPVAATGPGIFVFPDNTVNPSRSGSRGQTYTLFITGEGQVTPAVSTGTTPSPRRGTPTPLKPVSVTIGGVTAPIQFVGIPSWSVGVTQINFTVPQGVEPGKQPVVVTVGNVSSAPAMFTVQ